MRDMKIEQQAEWDIKRAQDTYGIKNWGNGYFDISPDGEVIIKNPKDSSSVQSSGLSLVEVIEGLRDRDLHMPALLRIENIIDHSISTLNESF